MSVRCCVWNRARTVRNQADAHKVSCKVGCTRRENRYQQRVQMWRRYALLRLPGVQGFEPQCTDLESGVHHDQTGRAWLPPPVEHTAGILIKRNLEIVSDTAHYCTEAPLRSCVYDCADAANRTWWDAGPLTISR